MLEAQVSPDGLEYDELDAKFAEFLGKLESLCKGYRFGIVGDDLEILVRDELLPNGSARRYCFVDSDGAEDIPFSAVRPSQIDFLTIPPTKTLGFWLTKDGPDYDARLYACF